jgi:hypothetical protein
VAAYLALFLVVTGGTAAALTDNDVLQYNSSVPGGKTLTGAWMIQVVPEPGPARNLIGETLVSFPVPAPVALTNANIRFAPTAAATLSSRDSTCKGTVNNPTAPRGKVCIYVSNANDQGPNFGFRNGTASGFNIHANNRRHGFRISAQGTGNLFIAGTWAYTAPVRRGVRQPRS